MRSTEAATYKSKIDSLIETCITSIEGLHKKHIKGSKYATAYETFSESFWAKIDSKKEEYTLEAENPPFLVSQDITDKFSIYFATIIRLHNIQNILPAIQESDDEAQKNLQSLMQKNVTPADIKNCAEYLAERIAGQTPPEIKALQEAIKILQNHINELEEEAKKLVTFANKYNLRHEYMLITQKLELGLKTTSQIRFPTRKALIAELKELAENEADVTGLVAQDAILDTLPELQKQKKALEEQLKAALLTVNSQSKPAEQKEAKTEAAGSFEATASALPTSSVVTTQKTISAEGISVTAYINKKLEEILKSIPKEGPIKITFREQIQALIDDNKQEKLLKEKLILLQQDKSPLKILEGAGLQFSSIILAKINPALETIGQLDRIRSAGVHIIPKDLHVNDMSADSGSDRAVIKWAQEIVPVQQVSAIPARTISVATTDGVTAEEVIRFLSEKLLPILKDKKTELLPWVRTSFTNEENYLTKEVHIDNIDTLVDIISKLSEDKVIDTNALDRLAVSTEIQAKVKQLQQPEKLDQPGKNKLFKSETCRLLFFGILSLKLLKQHAQNRPKQKYPAIKVLLSQLEDKLTSDNLKKLRDELLPKREEIKAEASPKFSDASSHPSFQSTTPKPLQVSPTSASATTETTTLSSPAQATAGNASNPTPRARAESNAEYKGTGLQRKPRTALLAEPSPTASTIPNPKTDAGSSPEKTALTNIKQRIDDLLTSIDQILKSLSNESAIQYKVKLKSIETSLRADLSDVDDNRSLFSSPRNTVIDLPRMRAFIAAQETSFQKKQADFSAIQVEIQAAIERVLAEAKKNAEQKAEKKRIAAENAARRKREVEDKTARDKAAKEAEEKLKAAESAKKQQAIEAEQQLKTPLPIPFEWKNILTRDDERKNTIIDIAKAIEHTETYVNDTINKIVTFLEASECKLQDGHVTSPESRAKAAAYLKELRESKEEIAKQLQDKVNNLLDKRDQALLVTSISSLASSMHVLSKFKELKRRCPGALTSEENIVDPQYISADPVKGFESISKWITQFQQVKIKKAAEAERKKRYAEIAKGIIKNCTLQEIIETTKELLLFTLINESNDIDEEQKILLQDLVKIAYSSNNLDQTSQEIKEKAESRKWLFSSEKEQSNFNLIVLGTSAIIHLRKLKLHNVDTSGIRWDDSFCYGAPAHYHYLAYERKFESLIHTVNYYLPKPSLWEKLKKTIGSKLAQFLNWINRFCRRNDAVAEHAHQQPQAAKSKAEESTPSLAASSAPAQQAQTTTVSSSEAKLGDTTTPKSPGSRSASQSSTCTAEVVTKLGIPSSVSHDSISSLAADPTSLTRTRSVSDSKIPEAKTDFKKIALIKELIYSTKYLEYWNDLQAKNDCRGFRAEDDKGNEYIVHDLIGALNQKFRNGDEITLHDLQEVANEYVPVKPKFKIKNSTTKSAEKPIIEQLAEAIVTKTANEDLLVSVQRRIIADIEARKAVAAKTDTTESQRATVSA